MVTPVERTTKLPRAMVTKGAWRNSAGILLSKIPMIPRPLDQPNLFPASFRRFLCLNFTNCFSHLFLSPLFTGLRLLLICLLFDRDEVGRFCVCLIDFMYLLFLRDVLGLVWFLLVNFFQLRYLLFLLCLELISVVVSSPASAWRIFSWLRK